MKNVIVQYEEIFQENVNNQKIIIKGVRKQFGSGQYEDKITVEPYRIQGSFLMANFSFPFRSHPCFSF